MAQNFLNLLDGHAFVNRPSRHGPAELVGVDGFEIQHAAHFAKADFHPADGQPVVGVRRETNNARLVSRRLSR